jgi:hypothetical protein
VPDTFIGKLFLFGLLLQISQIISRDFMLGMSRYGKEAKPEK